MKSNLVQSVKNLKYENLPVRKDATREAIPIRLTPSVPSDVNLEHLKAAIRLQALASLINYNSICVCPLQCRFFSLYGSNETYFATSKRVTFGPYYTPSKPRSLFIIKECALKVKGYRAIRLTCPFKSVRELSFEENSKERTDSRLAQSRVTETEF